MLSEPQRDLGDGQSSLEHAFVRAFTLTSRSAWTKFKKARGVLSTDEAGVKTAAEEFRQVSLLSDENLRTLCARALEAGRGRAVLTNDKFPAVLWLGGATVTWDGRSFLGTISDFVLVLEERAKALAPKRAGWVIEPVTNPEGRRTNEKTLAMHALFLDCDGSGEWDQLLATLRSLNYAFVAYQSGGWTAATPKWRVVLPLHAPHDTSTEVGQKSWKALYNCARVVFGSAAGLRGIGFDPATETPCCPWFLTERREATDPPRKIVWQVGHALDLVSMVLELPEIPSEYEAADGDDHEIADRVQLDDERTEEIVEALAAATNRVSSGRRDIYMALPGVLLDRGIEPESVLQIIEAVSERYPRSHPDKHADNIHCAKTTIAKWENEGAVTRIGTLQNVAPEVAAAVDDVLPSGDQRFWLMATQSMEQSAPVVSDAVAAIIGGEPEDTPDWQAPVTIPVLRKFIVSLRRKKRKWQQTKCVKDGIHWELLDRLLTKRALAAPAECDSLTQMSGLQTVNTLAGMLAYKLPKNTPFDAIKEIARESLNAMLKAGEDVEIWFAMLKRSYTRSLAGKLEADEKRKVEEEKSKETTRTYYMNGGRF